MQVRSEQVWGLISTLEVSGPVSVGLLLGYRPVFPDRLCFTSERLRAHPCQKHDFVTGPLQLHIRGADPAVLSRPDPTWRAPKTVRALCAFLTQANECRVAGTEVPVVVGLVSSSLTRQALKWPLVITYLWTEPCPAVRCSLANPRLRSASRVAIQTQAFCGRTNCPS